MHTSPAFNAENWPTCREQVNDEGTGLILICAENLRPNLVIELILPLLLPLLLLVMLLLMAAFEKECKSNCMFIGSEISIGAFKFHTHLFTFSL